MILNDKHTLEGRRYTVFIVQSV